MKLFIVTGGAECVMLPGLQGQLEEPAVFRMKPHPGLRARSMINWTCLHVKTVL